MRDKGFRVGKIIECVFIFSVEEYVWHNKEMSFKCLANRDVLDRTCMEFFRDEGSNSTFQHKKTHRKTSILL